MSAATAVGVRSGALAPRQTHQAGEGAVLELPIVRLQVQLGPIKPGRAPWRVYRPEILHEVVELIATPDGVVGVDAEGTEHIDVHNTRHPLSRDRKGRAGISVMATGDYGALRERYGRHLVDGIAGESILVDYPPGLAGRSMPPTVTLRLGASAPTAPGVAVRPDAADAGVIGGPEAAAGVDGVAGTLAGGAADLLLTGVHIAEPCVEFTRFCLGLPASDQVGDDVRQGLLDLGGGARGYKMVATRSGVRIRRGDVLLIEE